MRPLWGLNKSVIFLDTTDKQDKAPKASKIRLFCIWSALFRKYEIDFLGHGDFGVSGEV